MATMLHVMLAMMLGFTAMLQVGFMFDLMRLFLISLVLAVFTLGVRTGMAYMTTLGLMGLMSMMSHYSILPYTLENCVPPNIRLVSVGLNPTVIAGVIS